MIARHRGAAAVIIAGLGLSVALDARAQTSELDQLSEDSARLGVVIEGLTATPVENLAVDKRRRFNQRLEQALDLFLADDYVNVGVLLYDLVEDPNYRAQPRYNEAVYYLAQSLYQMNQFSAARLYFERLVELNDRRYLDDAVRQLIVIADRTRKWDRVDEQVQILAARGPLDPSIAYIYMKSLLRQDAPDRAKSVLANIPKSNPLWGKARYLAAVADVEQGRFDEARAGFDELRALPNVYQDASEVRDLAAINVGRLYLEESQLTEAIDAYQDVRRDSEFFERALFEVTWTYIRAAARSEDENSRDAEYAKATRALEILLLAERERPIVPEARLLLGNIRLRMDEFEGATEAFTSVVDRYAPVRRELGALTGEDATPEEYYDEVVRRRKSGGSLLPDLALRWAANEEELREALLVVSDLDESDGWLDESEELVRTLLDVLRSEQRAAFFPGLRDVQVKSVEARNTLFALRRRLVGIERSVVADRLSAEQNEQLDAIAAERLALEPEYAKLPQRIEEYRSQADTMRQDMRELLRQVHVVEVALSGHQRELVELTRLLSEKSGEMTPDQLADTQDNIDLEARVVDELLVLSKGLTVEIGRQRELISDTMERGDEAESVRERYEGSFDREQEILETALRAMGDTPVVRRIEAQRLVLAGHREELARFNERLRRVVDEKSKQVVNDVMVQKQILESLGSDSTGTREVAQQVVGQVAVDSMSAVEDQFQNIVLRADVGIVDVAWAEKEATTREITKKVGEQRRELERFDAEFREVLNDE